MFRETYTQRLQERASSPEIALLLARYDRALRGTNGCADYASLNLSTLDEWRDQLMILTPNGAGDYTYLQVGRSIVEASGLELTGLSVGDLPGELAVFSIASYDRATRENQPVLTLHRVTLKKEIGLWERLILPTRTSSGQVFLVVFVKRLAFREELLSNLMETSPNGILVLQSTRTDDSQIEDAVIVAANRNAGDIFGQSSGSLIGASARDTFPRLRSDQVWERCAKAMATGLRDELDQSISAQGIQRWFKIALAPVRDGLAMTFSDVTELKLANLALQSRAASLAVEVGKERAVTEALSSEIRKQRERESELQRLAETDPLTGLLNRRGFEAVIDTQMAETLQAEGKLCLVMVDLDHFKKVNDTYGHAGGDQALFTTAERLSSRTRSRMDVVGRFGGEEFAICLAGAPIARALQIAEELRQTLEEADILTDDGIVFQVTASFGVAEWKDGESFASLFARADSALYMAKRNGRNRVELATPDLEVIKIREASAA
jgi:diguanylate cyclase (GGDEF)-like protein/PAS domain S-box-containing protein